MRLEIKILIGVFATAAFVFILAYYLSWLNAYTFGWAAAIIISYGGCVVALQIMNLRARKEWDVKKGFQYCWRRANEILMTMDNADALEWRGGIDRKSSLKAFTVGTKLKHYRAMYGRLVRGRQEAIVIYCVEDDDIVEFVANISPDRIRDPWSSFSPAERKQMPYGGMPYDRRYSRGRGTPYVDLGGPGSFAGEGPDQEFVDRAFKNQEGRG